MKSVLVTFVAAFCAATLLAGGIAVAQTLFLDELTSSVNFYKSRYPTTNGEPANWDAYINELREMKKASIRGNRDAVRVGMGNWFEMLKNREHGIDPKAADELFRIAVLATPFDEYNISVPTPVKAEK